MSLSLRVGTILEEEEEEEEEEEARVAVVHTSQYINN